MSMDHRLLRVILGSFFLRVFAIALGTFIAAFALGTFIAEWNQKQIQPEPPLAKMEDRNKQADHGP